MSLLFPAQLFAYNTGTQNLFTIDNFIAPSATTRGVSRYGSVGNQATLTYSEFPIDQGGADADLDTTTGIAIVRGGSQLIYLFTAQATFNGTTPVRIKMVNTNTNTQVGNSVPADGTTLSMTVRPMDFVDSGYKIVAYTVDESLFTYPAQIDNAQLTVQLVAGFNNGF